MNISFNERNYEMVLLSSLVKVFQDERPKYQPETLCLSSLKGETVSFQVAYSSDYIRRQIVEVRIESEISDYVGVRTVEQVPVSKATNSLADDNYLKTTSGLYPDLLQDPINNKVKIRANQWSALWIDIEVPVDSKIGTFDIEVQLLGTEDINKGEVLCSATMQVTIYDAVLANQEILHTEWFYADCLADYYMLDVFSEDHWEILENFLSQYASRGCNMVLTPLFTYTLDTEIGEERTTTQLIDIEVKDGAYIFNFDKLERWVRLCQKLGIEYFEMSHIFSQWGAKYAPKILAMVEGREEQIFGWHTLAVGAYTDFLKDFLPKLEEKLFEWEIADKTYFHVSDVPRQEHLDTYKASHESLGDLLKNFKTFEAVAHYEYYDQGLIEIPVAATHTIHSFIDNNVEELWAYYCTGQFRVVSNRFISMPSARNRIIGIQLYKYGIHGFLHWGYNFYNSSLSFRKIDPYRVTDADDGFPAGDPFLVYPGEDGKPEESIRMMVLYQAFTDHRALKYLESLTSKDYVVSLIDQDLFNPITFYDYPKDDSYIINLRNRVNREIVEALK